MNRKTVIVMTYFERPYQLNQTLKSLQHSKHDNFEVVIVDDNSTGGGLYLTQGKAEPYGLKTTVLGTYNKSWTNPEPAYNIGLYYAMLQKPEIIILQNAECYHVNDVLMYADQHLTDKNYISFSCFSIDKHNTFAPHDITALCMANDMGASFDGQNAWYNHPRHRAVGFDFCSAITASNMLLLNGYDERFSDGCGYGDDYLLARVRMLGLQVNIPEPPAPFVVHQWHYNIQPPADKAVRVERNRLLLQALLRDNDPRAKHIHTQDLCKSSS